MIPDCDGRSDGQTVGQTESIIANTALCIARAMLTRCKNGQKLQQQSKVVHTRAINIKHVLHAELIKLLIRPMFNKPT